MDFFNEQLQIYQEQIARKEQLQKKLNKLYEQKRDLDRKVIRLKVEKQIEQEDVDKFEGLSLSAFFYFVIGKRGKKLDKERQEAYAASVKYDTAVREFTEVEELIKSYSNEISSLRGCEEKYASLFQQKMDEIKQSGTEKATEILRLEERIAKCDAQIKEYNEAISEGNKAISIVSSVIEHLNRAKKFANWDLFGGGVISEYEKHNALDNAQRSIEELHVQMRRFKTEIADVAMVVDNKVNFDGLEKFVDYFIDGFFVNLSVLDHIQSSLANIANCRNQINNVVNRLKSLIEKTEKNKADMKRRIDELILNS